MNKKLKNQVAEILSDFGDMVKKIVPLTKEGNIDMVKFSKMKEYKSVCKELSELGVNTECLSKNGFFVASMLLKIK